MTGTPKLTPRTKGGQVAPEGASPPVPSADLGPGAQEARVAPDDAAPGAADEKDVAKRVARMVQHAGRDALRSYVRLYGRMMIPVGLVSAWMFGMFAAISYFVPHWMCEEEAVLLSGSSLGLSSCVYVTDGKYTPYKGSKVFWLVFWAVEASWMAFFPGFIAKAMFGSCMSRLQMAVTVGTAVAVAACVLVTALVWGMALNNFYVLGASAVGSLLTVVTCSSAAVRFTGAALMRWRFILLFAFAGQINTFYLFILPRLITAQAQDALGGMGLTVVRLFVHPAIWTVVLFYFRTVQRHLGRIKDLTQVCFIMWPFIYSSLYGRFLMLQLDSVGSVVVLNFMFACFHIAAQLDGRGSDSWWLSLLYGERAKDAMQATALTDEMELVNQLAGSMMEASSIVAASALLSFGGVATSPGVPPDQSLIWFNAAMQLLTTLVFNLVEVVACGKFNALQWGRAYPRSVARFLSYAMVVVTLGGSRLCVELLLLFCPRSYDEHGILLEQCDRPSLFQAIGQTLGKSRRGPEDTAPWFPAEYVNGTWVATE